ncbi:1,2-phenylacetyl-CoA epoxidase subunit PaaD [Phytoactinopolyspora endophytica]|uniref:1,2-phenylacetyl-CoA epoxidase subunit PaaD n=1 Tax=Phytoactinopolyspora endophytica TaxID=1642495 RepID=UPI00101DE81D|nr:1,2-phenylacetyl-CoA epoxidase subunit PaaD [Phytoactinopolyspora endophytica]
MSTFTTSGIRAWQGGASGPDSSERSGQAVKDDAARAWAVAGTVTDPELPMLTLADLGVLRDVRADGGRVVVSITPTYTGCPAMDTMRDDLVHALNRAGYDDVEVRTVLSPPWSTDWISDDGRRKLAEAGIAPPGAAPTHPSGPIPLTLTTRRPADVPASAASRTGDVVDEARASSHGAFSADGQDASETGVACPRCGSAQTEEVSRFSATACKALRRCRACQEPFEHVKEI